jgi:ribonuclease HI
MPTIVNSAKWIAFADGASSGNPGPGGWGAIVSSPEGATQELGGAESRTTNNRMELLAAIEALRQVPASQTVEIFTDSTYVIKGITQWIWNWIRTGWKSKEGKDVLNRELWEALLHEVQRIGRGCVKFSYVPGHSGVPGNERADEIAVAYSRGLRPSLFRGEFKDYGVDLALTLPEGEKTKKTASPSPMGKKASRPSYYLSVLGSIPARHSTWSECEQRVKGQSGARFKKVSSPEEERSVLESWGLDPTKLTKS